MKMDEIRKIYKVPAKRGGRVKYVGDGVEGFGTIKGSTASYLKILIDGERTAREINPHLLYYL